MLHTIYGWLRRAVLVAALSFFVAAFVKTYSAVSYREMVLGNIPAILFFILLYTVGIVLNIKAWTFCHSIFEKNSNSTKSGAIWALSIPLRFLPGSFASLWWRGDIARRMGLSAIATLLASSLESYLLLLTAFPALLFLLFHKLELCSMYPLYISLAILPLMLHPAFVKKLTGKLTKKEIQPDFSFSSIAFAFLLIVLMWIAWGGALYIFTKQSFDSPISLFLLPAASWLSGALVLIAPKGLGVQEACLVYILSKYIPVEKAVLLSIFLRLLTSAVELFYFLISKKFYYDRRNIYAAK